MGIRLLILLYMGIEEKDMNNSVTPPVSEEGEKRSPLGYIEGTSGALTPYYSEEERKQLQEDINENKD